MSRAAPSAAHQAGLAAALVVVRLVLALLNTWLADLADLPPTHPDRRLHARLIAQLTRAEAQILADMAAEARIAPTRPARARIPPRARLRTLPHPQTAPIAPGRRSARAPPQAKMAPASERKTAA